MEGDFLSSRAFRQLSHFNPLPPHGGRRALRVRRLIPECISIHSLRMEGDAHYGERGESLRIISIHSLRMEGDEALSPLGEKFGISIHSLRMEGDHHLPAKCRNGMKISIHSLRMEGDRRR